MEKLLDHSKRSVTQKKYHGMEKVPSHRKTSISLKKFHNMEKVPGSCKYIISKKLLQMNLNLWFPLAGKIILISQK